jgi:hypothetical protein
LPVDALPRIVTKRDELIQAGLFLVPGAPLITPLNFSSALYLRLSIDVALFINIHSAVERLAAMDGTGRKIIVHLPRAIIFDGAFTCRHQRRS